MPHHYRITVQPLGQEAPPLHFDIENHDELIDIIEKTRQLGAVPDNETVEFTIGLKLFAEVMVRHRKDPLFRELWPHLGTFMKGLKAMRRELKA